MKLTKSQKKILKSIPNEKSRLEQKLQFKLQNRFFSRKPIVFVDGKLETDNPQIIEFLSQHPMCKKEHPEFQRFVMTPKGLVPMSDEISNMIDKGEFKTWYSTSAEEVNKRFDEFANEFISPEKESKVKVEIVKDEKLKGTGYENSFFKVTIPIGTPIQDSLNAVDEFFKQKTEIGNKIISEEKEKELFLNNQFLQDFLDKCNNLKILQNFKTKCVKYQNYEYATKFRQKVWDILVTLSTEKLIELVQDGTIELIDMSRAIGRQKDKFAEMFPKPEGKRIDVLDSFFCVITEENVADLSTLYEKIMGEKSILPIGKVLFFYPNITTISVRDISSFDKIYFCYESKRFIECVYSFFPKSANDNPKQFTLEDMRKIYVNGILDNQNLLVTPETCQITFDMHLRNVEKKQ